MASKQKKPDVAYHADRIGNAHSAAALAILDKRVAALEKQLAPKKATTTKNSTTK